MGPKKGAEPVDVDLYHAQTERINVIAGQIVKVVRIFITGVIGFYLIHSLKSYLQFDEGRISAFAQVVSAFKMHIIIPTIATALMGVVAWRERKGKQRAIQEKGHFQQVAERQDPERTSSGLTEIGTTPE